VTFKEILAQVIDWLQQDKRLSYRALKRQFALGDDYLDDLKAELIEVRRVALDEDGRVLVWTGDTAPAAATPSVAAASSAPAPHTYTPSYLAEKILTSRSALEGERKQVTVLFADLKGSMELLAERDPEEARPASRSRVGAHDGRRAPLRRHGESGHGRWHHGPLWCAPGP
jgi:hypothetical protein